MQEEQKTVDIGDENEEAQEIDLDAPAPEQSLEEEIHVERVEDNSQSADASQESSEQPVVQDSKQKEKTKGGLILAETSLEKQQVASQCGLVLRMGPDCYRDKERYPEGPWCKEKDWVIFARYAGSRIKIEGGEVRMLNDDEILATVDNPEDIIHEF